MKRDGSPVPLSPKIVDFGSDGRMLFYLGPSTETITSLANCVSALYERVKEINCGDWIFHGSVTNVSELWQTHWNCARKINIDDCLYLDLEKVFETVGPRVDLYLEGLKKIEEKSTVLDGKFVFKNTRLSVLHVGKMYERGEFIENILEDYPYLEGDDIRFAQTLLQGASGSRSAAHDRGGR